MKQLLLAPALALAVALPVHAEVAQEKEGFSLMEEGARLFLRGLMDQMEPAVEEFEGMLSEMEPALRSFAREMGPKLQTLLDEVEDWSLYEAPEVLPNGDIIIRRKQKAQTETDI
ncbi:hypothetical protein [Pseudaestuariivita atlantica]|uniref:AAA+ family ATPase n=1 Tax=Pseudaestuariivita atlantica TaxID=1317121 RepID=A0A0L1JQN1_9RHOB|nr:hypothetical protein [Pseudaestuariivita atlantica]KNG94094.1 hypothetical protein ATO11_07570 [Pseudaestuariivita atlantica]